MPQMLRPTITGTVTIELSMTDARTLMAAMDKLLDEPSTTWHDTVLRRTTNGDTCNQFLQALKKATDG